jgi:L,D-transpeptidase ErfK/SrfK
MRHTERNSKMRAVMATLLLALARASAQETHTGTPRMVVSIQDRKLALLDASGRVEKIYDTAIGKPSTPSPVGTFTIINRVVNPTYYGPGLVVPPSAANPLGSRWMGLDRKSFGIHGTNAPRSIGRAASHGCIRMRKADLEELFEQIRVGDIIEIRGERDETIARIFGGTPEGQLVAMVAGGAGR